MALDDRREDNGIVFVTVPYGALERPAIGPSLLKSALGQAGMDSEVIYANLLFAEKIGVPVYQALGNGFVEFFLGEWTFAGAAFPDFKPDFTDLFRYAEAETQRTGFKQRLKSDDIQATLLRVRALASEFVRDMANDIVRRKPAIVGCGSSFNQHCAGLALLREIRRLDPSIITLMGGANCEGEMGAATKAAFDWVDFVVSGEADEIIVPLCRALLENGRNIDVAKLPAGVICDPAPVAGACGKRQAPRAAVGDMDQVAIPDFDDYFAALKRVAIGRYINPGLLYESSRGCWWGARSHCTFCGLNGSSIGYRSKSPERVLEELAVLSDKHNIKSFEFVDNILDMDYFKNVLPALADRGYTIFFETKSNLSRRHVELLAGAGIKWIQPGIESIHDGMLKLIGKGCTAAINIQLLKWSEEFGVCVFWIFLVNLPFEQDEWYAEMAEVVPFVSHLQPPLSITPLQYHRFSLYHADPDAYGVALRPLDIYKYIYPVSERLLSDLVYFFEPKEATPPAAVRPGFDKLTVALREWWRLYDDKPSRPVLEMCDTDSLLTLTDTRPCAEKPRHVLSGLTRTIYQACDSAQSLNGLLRMLQQRMPETDEHAVRAVVDELLQSKLMIELSGKFLSLAVRRSENVLVGLSEFPGGRIDQEALERALSSA